MPRQKSRFEPSQPDKRRYNRWTDQHGRRWGGTMDINSGQPIGPLNLIDADPPLVPEQKYFRFQPLDNMFKIDYRAWIQDREQALTVFERRRRRYAQKLYGERAGQMLRENPAELDREVGVAPAPVEPVLAAASGNKWILGLSDAKPSWAERFFPEDDPSVALDTSRSLTGEALARWREQFPDAGAEEEDEDDVFDMDSISPAQKQWLAETASEEAELEAAGELE